jgi:predicted membrane-bound spermidine synthase
MVAPASPAETISTSSGSARFWPFALYALTGFTGVLAEQGFEKYMSLLVGATVAASSVVICAYFLGFAVGSWAIGALLRRGVAMRPLRTYGALELLAGIACIVFSYGFHSIAEALGPIQNPEASAVAKFSLRFVRCW